VGGGERAFSASGSCSIGGVGGDEVGGGIEPVAVRVVAGERAFAMSGEGSCLAGCYAWGLLVSRAVRPGPASLAGLVWLARVGPSPLEAWRVALGWSVPTAEHHARRLERAGWLSRHPTSYGEGSLLLATREGIERAAVPVASARPPAPTWWAHTRACAWTAAWLTQRGQLLLGCREVDGDDRWRGELRWRDRGAWRTSGHRPDLVRVIDETPVTVEVELARKSSSRLSAILELHALWRLQGKTGGVVYVCGSERTGSRVRRIAERHGLSRGSGGLGLRTLAEARAEARELASRSRAVAA
jgi:hypothetical protein